MSTSSINAINSQPTTYSPDVFNSFDQCNHALYDVNRLTLQQYFEITNSIPFDLELEKYVASDMQTSWLRSVLSLFLESATLDIRDYKISLASLSQIGFDIDSYSSKIPRLIQSITNTHDDQLKREKRFLSKHKFIEGKDYIIHTIDTDGEIISIGHYITRLALYKLVSNRYGHSFMNTIISRVCQILYYYDDYVQVNSDRYIRGLQSTIDDLSSELINLKQDSHLMRIVSMEDYAQERPSTSQCYNKYCESSYEDASVLRSDQIMKDKEYTDEIYTIHHMIEANINKVDVRISELHNKLSSITTKIDDIVGSIAFAQRNSSSDSSESMSYLTEDSRLEVDYNDRKSDIRPSYHIDDACRQSNSEPMLNHINQIFREYRAINDDTPRYSACTPPFTAEDERRLMINQHQL
jgi:hypothetical protein